MEAQKIETIRLYLDAEKTGEVSFTEIGKAVGLTGTRVKSILTEAGYTPTSNAKRGRKPIIGRLPLSPTHGVIGRRVKMHRLDTLLSDYGRQIGLSRSAVSAIETGHYDLTLSNIQSIAAHMGVTVEELMKEKV